MNEKLKHLAMYDMDEIISGVDALARMMKSDVFKMDYYVREKGGLTMGRTIDCLEMFCRKFKHSGVKEHISTV